MADISIIKTPDNISYNIKDDFARTQLEGKVDQITPLIEIDTQAETGTDDYNLKTIIRSLNWHNDVYQT